MLVEETLFGRRDKVQVAIDRLRTFEPTEGYYLAFSGGKDSQAVYHLCREARVKFDAHYSLTIVDPPEVIYFMREHYPDVAVEHPGITMWDLIVKKGMPPTRIVRYCCDVLKERGGQGRFVTTGVRWSESARRKIGWGVLELNSHSNARVNLMNDNDEARRLLESCVMKSMHTLNPIIDWLEEDVWEYLDSRGVPHCCLYDEGYSRIGCIGCPLAGAKQMKREFARYPKYEQAYLRAFDRMLQVRIDNGKPYLKWHCGQDVMDWWLRESGQSVPENQITFEDISAEGVDLS